MMQAFSCVDLRSVLVLRVVIYRQCIDHIHPSSRCQFQKKVGKLKSKKKIIIGYHSPEIMQS